MNTIRMNDGTIVENATCLYDDMHLFVYITGMDIVTGAILFSDSSKTENIMAYKGNTFLQEYKGYTELYAISMEFGNCNIVLRKG